jgi:hypothetical protein
MPNKVVSFCGKSKAQDEARYYCQCHGIDVVDVDDAEEEDRGEYIKATLQGEAAVVINIKTYDEEQAVRDATNNTAVFYTLHSPSDDFDMDVLVPDHHPLLVFSNRHGFQEMLRSLLEG